MDEIWQNPEIFSFVLNSDQNLHFWPLWTWEGLNLAKYWHILVMSKIWLKTDISDHSEHGKDEVWQNLEIFSRGENLA